MKRIAAYVSLVLVLILSSGCATVKSQYEAARKDNTISAYQEFLSRHPSGQYAVLAQTRIETLNFERALSVNSIEAYDNFMRSSQSDLFKNYALERIQMIYSDEYAKAKEADTIDAYEDYMARYPGSNYLAECTERLEYLHWMRTLKRHDAVGYYRYLYQCDACEKHNLEAQARFAIAARKGAQVDLAGIINKVQGILNRSDILVMQSESTLVTKRKGPIRMQDLSSANDVLVSLSKKEPTDGAGDGSQENGTSVKLLHLTKRVPENSGNPIAFDTVIFYSQNDDLSNVIFIEEGRGYLFRETGTDL